VFDGLVFGKKRKVYKGFGRKTSKKKTIRMSKA
jgi:hypothetical protein